jgi:hypothetical protein
VSEGTISFDEMMQFYARLHGTPLPEVGCQIFLIDGMAQPEQVRETGHKLAAAAIHHGALRRGGHPGAINVRERQQEYEGQQGTMVTFIAPVIACHLCAENQEHMEDMERFVRESGSKVVGQ